MTTTTEAPERSAEFYRLKVEALQRINREQADTIDALRGETEVTIRQDPATLRAYAKLLAPDLAARLTEIADDLEESGRHESIRKLIILSK